MASSARTPMEWSLRPRSSVGHSLDNDDVLRAPVLGPRATSELQQLTGPPAADWRELFYLYAFLDVLLSQRGIERRERVWIRRFLAHRGKRHLFARMDRSS